MNKDTFFIMTIELNQKLLDAYDNELKQFISLIQINHRTTTINNTIRQKWKELIAKMIITPSKENTTNGIKFHRHSRDLFMKCNVLICYVRDIEQGLGCRDLAYMMLYEWVQCFPDMVIYILHYFVHNDLKSIKPYGSWRDVRELMQYTYLKTNDKSHPLISNCIFLFCEQIKKDVYSFLDYCFNPHTKHLSLSLVSKWFPRENRKKDQKWMFKELTFWFFFMYKEDETLFYGIEMLINPDFDGTYNFQKKFPKHTTHQYKTMRRLVSSLNENISTIEPMMCNKEWHKITMDNVPSKAIHTYSNSLMRTTNRSKKETTKLENDRRRLCKSRYELYATKVKSSKIKVNSLTMKMLVKEAVSLGNESSDSIRRKLLDKKWNGYLNSIQDHSLHNAVIVLDMSVPTQSSIKNNKLLYSSEQYIDLQYEKISRAIEYAYLVSNPFRGRILISGGTPTWIDLNWRCNYDFVKMVNAILKLEYDGKSRMSESIEYLFNGFQECEMNDLSKITLICMTNEIDTAIIDSIDKQKFKLQDGKSTKNNNKLYDKMPTCVYMNFISSSNMYRNVALQNVYKSFIFTVNIDFIGLKSILNLSPKKTFNQRKYILSDIDSKQKDNTTTQNIKNAVYSEKNNTKPELSYVVNDALLLRNILIKHFNLKKAYPKTFDNIFKSYRFYGILEESKHFFDKNV